MSRQSLTTNCQNCVFRQLSNEGVQNGCKIQPLDGYEYELLDGSFKFKSKICQFKRNAPWGANLGSTEAMWRTARQEVDISYSIFIKDHDGKLDTIQKTCDSLAENKIKPVQLVVLSDLDQKLDKYLAKTEFQWEIMKYMGDSDYRAHILRNNQKSHFFCFIDAGMECVPYIFDFIDYKINNQGLRFRCIYDKNLVMIARNAYLVNEVPFAELIKLILKNKGHIYYADLARELVQEYPGVEEFISEKRLCNDFLGSNEQCS